MLVRWYVSPAAKLDNHGSCRDQVGNLIGMLCKELNLVVGEVILFQIRNLISQVKKMSGLAIAVRVRSLGNLQKRGDIGEQRARRWPTPATGGARGRTKIKRAVSKNDIHPQTTASPFRRTRVAWGACDGR